MPDSLFVDHLEETLERGQVEELFDRMNHDELEQALAEAQAEGVLEGAEFTLEKFNRS